MTRRPLALPLLILLLAPAAGQDDEGVKARVGKFVVEERGYFTRLVYDGTMIGTQINENYIVRADAPIPFGSLTPWDVLALEGAVARWDATHEPLSYYHRTGPVGAVFHHLRTRGGGADALAPVGVVGVEAGTVAAYARRGQRMTFYSVHPENRDLIEKSDRHFTYVRDARARGAELDFRYGPPRTTVAADADKRFGLLLVEMVEEGFDPGDRLTLEAVRLYFDRVTPDGIVALHTSNKYYRLEPEVERIARELKLAGRVWEDDAEGRPGKTASTWVVLARSEAALGVLARPAVEQVLEYGTRNEELVFLLRKYGPGADALGAVLAEWGGPEAERPKLTPSLVSVRHGPQASLLYDYAIRLRDAGRTGPEATLGKMIEYVYGPMFRPLVADPATALRTDANRPPLARVLPVAPPPREIDPPPVRVGKFLVEERGYFRRLVNAETDTLFGTQITDYYVVRADAPIPFGSFTPWDVLAAAGMIARWDPRQEPITYYHRTGPVGALFHHLRTRKGGADAAAPVGVVGLYAGTPAAYAVRGQAFTFYNAQPDLKGLVAESDAHFTYLRDARRRGATVEVRHGPARETLAADTGRRFALLLVEMVEESFDPGDRLTLEAVRLYLDRVTPDGIVALHTSNREFLTEAATERIARELKLVARVWNDDSEGRPGKTPSSWVVFARTEAALGPLARPAVEQALEYGTRNEELVFLLRKYGPGADALGAVLAEWGGPEAERPRLTPSVMSVRHGPQAAVLYQYALRLRDAGRIGPDATLGKVAETIFGAMFRPLVADPAAALRTDANRSPLPRLPPREPAKK